LKIFSDEDNELFLEMIKRGIAKEIKKSNNSPHDYEYCYEEAEKEVQRLNIRKKIQRLDISNKILNKQNNSLNIL
jgi:endonuclease YncB( thermonuclease family)